MKTCLRMSLVAFLLFGLLSVLSCNEDSSSTDDDDDAATDGDGIVDDDDDNDDDNNSDDDDDATTTDGDTDDDDDDVTEDGDADGDIDPTDGDGPDGDLEGECTAATAAADCQGGQGCINGVCAPCQTAEHCPASLGCVAGVCGACDSATDCRAGEGCRNDLCGSCLSPADCREGEGCRAGVCGACVEAADCAGLLCGESGLCVPCTGDEGCQAQYGEAFVCEGERCVRETCLSDADCRLQGELCAQNVCTPCGGTWDCLQSDAYGAGYQCLNGQCSEGNCETNDDCPTDEPICGGDSACRGCLPTGQGAHGECTDRFGAGWLCTAQGSCVEGDCLSTADCLSVNRGLCVLEQTTDGDTDTDAEGENDPPTAEPYTCRPCLDTTDDALCRADYGLDGLICVGGQCVEGNCHTDENCLARGMVCEETTHSCVDCRNDADCSDGARICENTACRDCLPGECGENRVCAGGACVYGGCWIDGEVIGNGATKAGDVCSVCNPQRSAFSWSPNEGMTCNDGSSDTYADACSQTVAGLCAGEPYACEVPSYLATCAVGVPHGGGPDDCTLVKKSSWQGCYVDDGCYAHNIPNPANSCEICNGGTGGWISKPVNTRCGACQTCQDVGDRRQCEFVPVGFDTNNDCTQDCQVCDGWGGCRWADAGTDPNDDCASSQPLTCGLNGTCEGGNDRCNYWTDVDGVNDNNECTVNDHCDGLGNRTGDSIPNGPPWTACMSGTKVCRNGQCGDCTGNDECRADQVCSSGSCVVGTCNTAPDCGPAGECRKFECISHQCVQGNDDSLSCTDNNACTIGDRCLGGVCQAGAPLSCSYLDETCKQGECNPANGLCQQANKQDGASCNDNDPCTVNDQCQSGACIDTDPKCPDDGLSCTTDCVAGSCTYERLADKCIIDGVCYQHGTENPENTCQECVATGPGAEPNDWSIDDSNTCSDAIECTEELCSQGECRIIQQNDSVCLPDYEQGYSYCHEFNGCTEYGWGLAIYDESTENMIQSPYCASNSSGNIFIASLYRGSLDFNPYHAEQDLLSSPDSQWAISVTKFNSEREYAWTRSILPETQYSYLTLLSISSDVDGNAFVLGRIVGAADLDPSPITQHLVTNATFILKLSSMGEYLWVKTFQTGMWNVGSQTDDNGNLYLYGTYGGEVDFNPDDGMDLRTSTGGEDGFISKYDSNGNYLWTNTINGSENSRESINSITIENDTIYAVGECGGYPYTNFCNSTYLYHNGAFVAKIQGEQSCNAKIVLKPVMPNAVKSVIYQSDRERVLVIGNDVGGAFDPQGINEYHLPTGTNQVFISSYSTSLGYIATKFIGGNQHTNVMSAIEGSSGSIYIAGNYDGTTDFDPSYNELLKTALGVNDYFILKMNADLSFEHLITPGVSGGGSNIHDSCLMNHSTTLFTGNFDHSLDIDPTNNSDVIGPAHTGIFLLGIVDP